MNQQIKATLASFPSLMSFSLIQHPPTQENSYNYTVSMLKVTLQLFQGEETGTCRVQTGHSASSCQLFI